MAQPRLSGHAKFVFWNGPVPSGSKDVSTQGCPAVLEVPGPPTKIHAAIITQSEPEAVPPARALVRSLGHNSLPSCTPPEPRIHTLSQVKTHSPPQTILPPFSVLSSLLFPKILPGPHVTLSSLGAERFQLSGVALGELDMKLCVPRVFWSSVELILSC